MDKKKCYYEDEKIKIMPFIMTAIGIILMIFFTVLKIKDPDNWAPNGYLIAMGFTFFWTWMVFGFTYYISIKPRATFLKEKDIILSNGKINNGEIIDSKKEVKVYTNGEPSAWRYYAQVKFDDGIEEKTFWTPALLINPDDLLSKNVVVYSYNNKYLATDFQISNNPINTDKNTESVEENYESEDTSIYNCIASIISGVIFTGFTGWIFMQAADIYTRIIIIPFIICGIGVLLKGILPLVFGNKKNKFKNLGMKIYLLGFSIFWFGFLIFFDYISIKQGSTNLVIFSLVFWIVGFLVIFQQFKRLK